MLTVHHLHRSQSERIVWLCEELGIDYALQCYDRDPATNFAPPAFKVKEAFAELNIKPEGATAVVQGFGNVGSVTCEELHPRGVKVVGATAHFVTTDLDEGPIIEQDTIRVDHSLGPNELIDAGQDVEATVLRRAVQWYAQRRILRDGARTIVFR